MAASSPSRVRHRHGHARVHVRVLALVVLVAGLVLVAGATFAASARPAPAHGVWPLQPRPPVVTGFHPPSSPWGSGHRGVDLGGHVGEPVHDAAAGRITFAGQLAGRGVVVVDHGATRTTYEPVDASVHVGEEVPAGAVIGRLQLFGSHCFPRACLHWGLIEGRDHYLDPLTLVGAAPVRLLPLAGALPSLRTPLVSGSEGLVGGRSAALVAGHRAVQRGGSAAVLGPEGSPGRLWPDRLAAAR